MNLFPVFLSIFLFIACKTHTAKEDATVWRKIKLDFRALDAEGLSGKADGKVSLNYEFCIPAEARKWKQVRKIDPSATLQKGAKGRVGCSEQQWLVIGSTHQKNYQRVLYELASLPYVERIEQTYWE